MKNNIFKAMNQITNAGDYLKDKGFPNSFIVEASQSFLSLMMVESRIIRAEKQKQRASILMDTTKKQPIERTMSFFEEDQQAMILEAFNEGFHKQDTLQLKDKYQINVPNKELETLLIALTWKLDKDGKSTKEELKPIHFQQVITH